jgi:homoserine O-acetyltransferase
MHAPGTRTLATTEADMRQAAPSNSPDGIDYTAAGSLAEGDEAVFSIPDFIFENGERLPEMKVGYVTHGRLNEARDNAILLLPGTANTRHSADGYIGGGRALDPTRDFIIAVDAIGAGTSSKPSDGLGAGFPRYSIRDMVRAQHALVTQALRLRRLKAVVGASMGAFQSLEWAIAHPEQVESTVLMVPAWRGGHICNTIVRSAIEVVALDPRWKGGHYTEQPLDGLRAAGRIYYPWTVTDAHLTQLSPEALEREIQATVDRAARWDAWDFVRRYQASAGHDVSVPFRGDLARALAHVKARTLLLPAATDRLLGLAAAHEIARHVRGARLAEVATARGHLGWRAVPNAPESAFITAEIIGFLNPGDKR